MALIHNYLRIFNKNAALNNIIALRNFSVTPKLQLKEIKEVQEGNNITIFGEVIPSPREKFLLKATTTTTETNGSVCPVCASGLEIKHTDVLILSQFVRSDGCMLPRRVTRLCKKQQKRMSSLVTMAHKAGLMPNLHPSNSKKDPQKRYGWKKFNKYFDETTIKFK